MGIFLVGLFFFEGPSRRQAARADGQSVRQISSAVKTTMGSITMCSSNVNSETDGHPADFSLEREVGIGYLGLRVSFWRHRTGLEVVSLACDDMENCFIAGFRTANCDDTGVQHILEHVVLGGSANYQVKSPCDELGRCSLATYVNGETYQDRTLYPFASINPSEFLNGVRVYLDAVFNPLLQRETFMQEGWRYELAGERGHETGLKVSGIVLNERRAQMNDVNDVALSCAYRELLPGHPLSCDAGGTPGRIECLSYESFRDYYRSHYGLNQAKLYFYGNIPTDAKLACVRGYLESACADRLASGAPVEYRAWPYTSPAALSGPVFREIAVESSGGSADDRCSFAMNWHLGKLLGKGEALGMELLTILLVEDDSSPLRRALLESGLCEDMLDLDEYETEHDECLFIVGAYGCGRGDCDAIRALCLDCLKECSEKGFTPGHQAAAFNQLRLRYMEIPNGYGLTLGRQIMRNWLSALDPMLGIDYRAALEELRQCLEADRDFLRNLLRRMLLDNPRRADLCYVSDGTLAARRRKEEAARLAGVWKNMDEGARARLRAELDAYAEYQNRTDSPEALEAFPRLVRAELPRRPFDPEVERRELPGGTVLLRGDVASPDVNFVKVAYDAGIFTAEELSLLPVFTSLMDSMGAGASRYGSFERRLAAAGAEMDVDMMSENRDIPCGGVVGAVTVRVGALADCWEKAMDCLAERCQRTCFREKGRQRDVLGQCWSQANLKLIAEDDALEYAMLRSGAGISPREAWNEEWYGVRGVLRLRDVLRQSKRKISDLDGVLEGMMEKLRASCPLIVSYVGDDRGYDALLERLPRGGAGAAWRGLPASGGAACGLSAAGRREGIDNGRAEACCVRSFRCFGYDDPRWAAMSVYAEILGEGHMMDAIRLIGGAYGCACNYSPGNGMLQMLSWRDPNPGRTFGVFTDAVGHIEHWTEAQVTGAIVGCVRGDVPLRASECCNVALWRELIGLDNAERARRREQLLDVRLADVAQAAEAMREMAGAGWNDCMVGDSRQIRELGFAQVGWRNNG